MSQRVCVCTGRALAPHEGPPVVIELRGVVNGVPRVFWAYREALPSPGAGDTAAAAAAGTDAGGYPVCVTHGWQASPAELPRGSRLVAPPAGLRAW
jgi:hypothetical protein